MTQPKSKPHWLLEFEKNNKSLQLQPDKVMPWQKRKKVRKKGKK